MLDTVAQVIDRFYRKKDYSSFKSLSSQPLDLFQELKSYIQRHKLVLSEEPDKVYPSKAWCVHFNDPKLGEFEASYTTTLKISKVAPLFYVNHEFLVKNKDKNALEVFFRGFRNRGFVKRQWKCHDEITKVLSGKGYQELTYSEFIEVPDWFTMPEGITNLGPNVTVEHLLFMDIFELCSKV